jgi:hypothetical protein
VSVRLVLSTYDVFFNRESRRKTPVIVAIKGKDREFGEAAISRVGYAPS